jgi:hypothetical protein
MLEQDWLTCTDPEEMLAFLRESATDRKLRLFAVACCRQIWPLLNQPARSGVETSERFADGRATRQELNFARHNAERFASGLPNRLDPNETPGWKPPSRLRDIIRDAVRAAAQPQLVPGAHPALGPRPVDLPLVTARAVVMAVAVRAAERVGAFEEWSLDVRAAMRQMRAEQAALVRDIFGNPFQPVIFDPAWRTPGVVAVAEAIYRDRRFGDLPVLADALEEAGCTSADILNHGRQPGEHVRGCWLVDLALNKE